MREDAQAKEPGTKAEGKKSMIVSRMVRRIARGWNSEVEGRVGKGAGDKKRRNQSKIVWRLQGAKEKLQRKKKYRHLFTTVMIFLRFFFLLTCFLLCF